MRLTLIGVACLFSGAVTRWVVSPSTQSLVSAARELTLRRQIDQAEPILRRILARDADHAEARLLLGALFYEKGDYSAAVVTAAGVDDANPNGPRARVIEGDSWFKLGRVIAAERCWKRALGHDDGLAIPRVRLARLYAMQLRREEWSRTLWQMYDHQEVEVVELSQLPLVSSMNWDDAVLNTLEQWAAADPEDLHSRRAIAALATTQGGGNETLRQLQSLRRQFPDSPHVAEDLLAEYLRIGDLPRAKGLLRNAKNLDPTRFSVARSLATIALRERRFEDCIRHARVALSTFAYDLPSHQLLLDAQRQCHSDLVDAEAETVRLLNGLHRLCLQLQASGLTPRAARGLLQSCRALQMNEEGRAWAAQACRRWPGDPEFQRWRRFFAAAPPFSARNPGAGL